MSGFTCPYCNKGMYVGEGTHKLSYAAFGAPKKTNSNSLYLGDHDESLLKIEYYRCPLCEEYSVAVKGIGRKVSGINTMVKPMSPARIFPEYVPKSIRNDYEEAYAILSLSPKASATLSRRCLQGMIRDFWGIKKDNLNQEISALKEQIQPDLWQALNDLRQLGNIGAHMEGNINIIIDIDEGEAERLIKLVELLIEEWYIAQHKRNQLFKEIKETNENKQAKRKGEE